MDVNLIKTFVWKMGIISTFIVYVQQLIEILN